MLVLTLLLFQFTERVVQSLFGRSGSAANQRRALQLQLQVEDKSKGDVDVNRNFSTSSGPLPLSKMSLEEKFKAAVKVIHSLPKDGESANWNAFSLVNFRSELPFSSAIFRENFSQARISRRTGLNSSFMGCSSRRRRVLVMQVSPASGTLWGSTSGRLGTPLGTCRKKRR